jgi:hypothetical protein
VSGTRPVPGGRTCETREHQNSTVQSQHVFVIEASIRESIFAFGTVVICDAAEIREAPARGSRCQRACNITPRGEIPGFGSGTTKKVTGTTFRAMERRIGAASADQATAVHCRLHDDRRERPLFLLATGAGQPLSQVGLAKDLNQ